MIQPLPTTSTKNAPHDPTGVDQSRGDAGVFRDALAQQAVGALSAILDPGASSSIPGAGTALREAAGAHLADATGIAAQQLITQEQQQGIRGRGRDAASVSANELRSSTPRTSEAGGTTEDTPQGIDRQPKVTQQPVGQRNVTPAESGSKPDTLPQQASHPSAGTHRSSPATSASASPSADPQASPLPGSAAKPAVATAGSQQAAVQAVQRIGAAQPQAARPASTPSAFSVERSNGKPVQQAGQPVRAKPLPQQDATAQVQRGLAQILRQRGGTLSMKLTPHELGEVKIALRMAQNRVEGTIDAQSVAARDLLKQNIDALRASLEQRGVTVDRLEVRLQGAAESDGQAQVRAEARQQHAGAQADAGGDRPTGDAGGGERHAGSRDGEPGTPDRDAARGATAPVRDDGHGRPDEQAGGWLRLDTTA